jgi:hypothetical protein
VIKDATGEFVLGFVFLVAYFAWLCAGLAISLPGLRPSAGTDRRLRAEEG